MVVWSEQYRLAALDWADKDNAARLLEDTRSAVLAQRMKALGDIPAAHAKRDVEASPWWHEFITRMVQAKTAANKARIELDYIRMKAMEEQSANANKRAEMRL
jgi:hypothetical protein